MNRIRILAVALAAAALCAGCYPQPPTLKAFTNQGTGTTRVVLFGDSLAAMAEAPAETLFALDDSVSLSYNAVGGTRFQHWADAMANVTPDETVIMELGTNNVSNEAINTGELPAHLYAALDQLAGAACLVVPNLNTTGGDLRGFPYDQRTRWVNDELAALVAAGTYPNLHVYDWAAESAGRPEILMGTAASPADWVHYNTAGTQAYAEMLVRLPEVCI